MSTECPNCIELQKTIQNMKMKMKTEDGLREIKYNLLNRNFKLRLEHMKQDHDWLKFG